MYTYVLTVYKASNKRDLCATLHAGASVADVCQCGTGGPKEATPDHTATSVTAVFQQESHA